MLAATAMVLPKSSICKRELVACLRQAHNKRLPRSKGQDRRGQIPDMLSNHVRPPEVEDSQSSAFQGISAQESGKTVAELIHDLAEQAELLDAEIILREINEDRTISGFPEV